ncbi:type A chloramphenicol O-acetyltransferase [Enterococcus sp. ALS3]|uniref:Chloramphenicol acetyltransferase n=1 Tax=Enterococcus alishanensis TaxID=1303817 RepID=A0ABS6TGK3_9ENTE|nr:type A chloramphenicol O-acetyltransferase [Enterococcus alishanensis]MBV7391972.1 type A chloramphenicol O-acetyltransferase [Enterococcus alishanensis]
MAFIPIDIKNWDRKEIFDYYFQQQTTFSLTKEIDVTPLYRYLKKHEFSFYAGFLFLIIKIANQKENFRMALNSKGELGYYETVNPMYTLFNKETTKFSCLLSEYSGDFKEFHRQYQADVAKYGNSKKLFPQSDRAENVINLSMIPWTSFSSFNLNIGNNPDYLLPIVTAGQFIFSADKVYLPIALQVHHAVCDGYHAAEFLNIFTEMASRPKEYL